MTRTKTKISEGRRGARNGKFWVACLGHGVCSVARPPARCRDTTLQYLLVLASGLIPQGLGWEGLGRTTEERPSIHARTFGEPGCRCRALRPLDEPCDGRTTTRLRRFCHGFGVSTAMPLPRVSGKFRARDTNGGRRVLIHGSNKSENQKEKTNSTLNSQPHPRHSTPKG